MKGHGHDDGKQVRPLPSYIQPSPYGGHLLMQEPVKRGPGRPRTIKDMRAYKTQKQREYRLRDKLNPSQAKLK